MLQQKEDDCEESDAGIIVLTRIKRSEKWTTELLDPKMKVISS